MWVGHEGDRECGFVTRGAESVDVCHGEHRDQEVLVCRVWNRVCGFVMKRAESVGFGHGEHRDQGMWVGHAWNRECGFVMRRTESVDFCHGEHEVYVSVMGSIALDFFMGCTKCGFLSWGDQRVWASVMR